MPARSAFNPFSSTSPLRKFGALDITPNGLQYNGLPYVGPVVDFKSDDPPELQPQQEFNGCVAQFDLSKPEEMEQYRALIQKFCSKQAVLSCEEKVYDPEVKSWRIFIRWMEPYYGPPAAVKQMVEEARKQAEQPARVLPETDLTAVKDAAEAKAEEAANASRAPYATVDEAIHSFSIDQDGKP